jgi:glycosyltransferase involved in cell wall biosynthesis
LHVVGDGNDINDLKRLAVDDKRIVFYGQKDKEFLREQIWPKIDLLINPSRVEESFGMVIIEAYANGVPVIASDIGALSNLVKEGETGWLFRAGDVSQLKYKLQNIIDEKIDLAPLKKKCIEEARQYSVTNYLNKFYEVAGLKK